MAPDRGSLQEENLSSRYPPTGAMLVGGRVALLPTAVLPKAATSTSRRTLWTIA